ncbi:hypothetical protein B0H17DRAFT_1215870 [Mycena rosella]|uniref:Uncharacterized protein n=1 Tax=Mycena rosella TaxID=1033263 RepID=A0AAD7FZ56_MYCRO|nr:hypothetical protein B0H17DRAFT_1215870 [Mycena rosella]
MASISIGDCIKFIMQQPWRMALDALPKLLRFAALRVPRCTSSSTPPQAITRLMTPNQEADPVCVPRRLRFGFGSPHAKITISVLGKRPCIHGGRLARGNPALRVELGWADTRATLPRATARPSPMSITLYRVSYAMQARARPVCGENPLAVAAII